MANDTLIDSEAIENLRALNPDDGDAFLRDIVSIFLEDTPVRLGELRQALASGDAAKFTRAAHSIKGSSSNLGATRLRGFAEALENDSRNRGLADLEPRVSELDNVFRDTEAALRQLLS
jgi:HPt (histidine-containing phosphotransfer) domain-containing protein